MLKRAFIAWVLVAALNYEGKAWIYPEHRDIFLLAMMKLDSAHRAELDRLYSLARTGYESRLDASVAVPQQGADVRYLDYAAWPAIAGDHSTSAENMVYNILHTDWILDVARICADLRTGIAKARNRSEVEGRLRDSDIRLMRADPEYVSRAGSNNAHFLLARQEVNTAVVDYFEHCWKEGNEINAIGIYLTYHQSAMYKAQRLAKENLTPEQRSALALSVLADEAFAIHFLEDSFAAGHVAGVWGNASLRKGTHDYYDEHGLEVTTWQGEPLVIMGDAWIRPQDAERASVTIMHSLEYVLDAANGAFSVSSLNDRNSYFIPDTFNIAKNNFMPSRKGDPEFTESIRQVVLTTPMPGLATGAGEIPRFRSELGPFIGFAPAARVSVVGGGFGNDQKETGVVPGLEVAVHAGLGLEGVLNQSGDGLVFIDLGYRLDGASSMKFRYDPENSPYGSVLPVIPSRDAFYFRFRMPYFVLPGDLLYTGPLVFLFSKDAFNKMVSTASQGGLIPWQAGLVSSIGRFQFILGREIGVTFNGFILGDAPMLIQDNSLGTGKTALVSLRSTQLEFPIVEYRPFRTFSLNQSSSLVIQLNAAVDIPGKVTMIEPADAPRIDLKSVWSMGIRIYFDWRYYFTNK